MRGCGTTRGEMMTVCEGRDARFVACKILRTSTYGPTLGARDRRLSSHGALPVVRAVRSYVPDAARSSVNRLQHHGRLWPMGQPRARAVSADGLLLGGRGRVSVDHLDEA